MNYRAYILDDEPKARENLVASLSKHNNWEILKEFSSSKNVLEQIVVDKPDVVFLDIQMPGESGLELAKKMQKLNSPPLVVFVTAFSDYALTAFDLYALDYLLKPFDNSRVDMCINKLEKVLGNISSHAASLNAQNAWATNDPLERIVIKSSSSLRIIPTEKIKWVAANGNYVDIYHQEGKHLLRGSLKSIYESLSKERFLQIHRGIIVQKNLVRELKTIDDEKFLVTLVDGETLPVGKKYRTALVEALTGR
ncbi:response regulator transcription factor [Aliikangiella marina]|uniref:Response regulator transcription factor n=1 Tax=Aliikangiella marina TaxID=1712262 RepID=A0A545TBW6_9GAMM|nr:LytTR family DNA-binding domain-containing protein [Aliikangiella marina]TQV74708.1 response regulator transcription factor [Aliikangiella marina]